MSLSFRGIVVIKFLLSFVLAVLCSYSIAAPDNQLLRRLDIQRGLFSDTYQSFDIDGQPIIYVLQENTTAITRGVAVMVADSGIPLVAQEGFSALANELNKVGWVTILLPAPDIGFIPTFTQDMVIEDDEKKAIDEETNGALITDLDISQTPVTSIDEQAFEEHEQQLVSLLQAVIEKSQEYPGFLLVISKGTSAAWLSKIYAEKTLNAPDAFVAISPFWPDRNRNQRLPQWIANTPMPVLDLYSSQDNVWSQTTVTQREVATVKSLKLQYRQRELLGFNQYRQYNAYLSKEIYGWISHMGW
ncbi:MAG: hypothetical protein ACI8Y3_000535 [Paraglaciecola sp.]